MSKMLLLVPRMYTEEEFKRLAKTLPEDFGARKLEFWNYVEEKLQTFAGKIQRVYRDEVCEGGEAGLAYLSSVDTDNVSIVRKLVNDGAVFEATEDAFLVAESKSWLEMSDQNPLDTMPLELYEATVQERDTYVTRRILQTLLDEETGILFLKPGRKTDLNESFKIIKVCRFEPSDYLRSWQVQQHL